MRERVEKVLSEAIAALAAEGHFPSGLPLVVEEPREEAFGDFTTNVAMAAAARLKIPARKVAEALAGRLGDGGGLLARAEVAGPGFLNLTLRREVWLEALAAAAAAGDRWGDSAAGSGRKVQVEFVSANPTGPLHVGHGRGAAVGDVLANLLRVAGWAVHREYYINDAGRQMEILGRSLLARARQSLGEEVPFPEDGYRGDYIRDIAAEFLRERGRGVLELPEAQAVEMATVYSKDAILAGIRKDLDDFGVRFDEWASERELLAAEPLEGLLSDLESAGLTYREEGALWLATTRFGDDKDRVLVRGNGQATYFANDILYHREKYRRGYDLVVDIWGADHHGYVDRMKAAVQALGRSSGQLEVVLVQLVRLMRRGEVVRMTTRGGEFDTLRQVMDEVGRDAARFFFVSRKSDAQLDFDLELAVRQSAENPVYYVQYAHARVSSIFRRLAEGGQREAPPSPGDLALLELPEELALMRRIVLYPDVVSQAAAALEPHRVTFFLTDLASRFHAYYNRHRVISAEEGLTRARLLLCRLIGRILAHGLAIVGVSAPENM